MKSPFLLSVTGRMPHASKDVMRGFGILALSIVSWPANSFENTGGAIVSPPAFLLAGLQSDPSHATFRLLASRRQGNVTKTLGSRWVIAVYSLGGMRVHWLLIPR